MDPWFLPTSQKTWNRKWYKTRMVKKIMWSFLDNFHSWLFWAFYDCLCNIGRWTHTNNRSLFGWLGSCFFFFCCAFLWHVLLSKEGIICGCFLKTDATIPMNFYGIILGFLRFLIFIGEVQRLALSCEVSWTSQMFG